MAVDLSQAPDWITDDWRTSPDTSAYMEYDPATGQVIRVLTAIGHEHTSCPTCYWSCGIHHPRCRTRDSQVCTLPCVLAPEWKVVNGRRPL